MEEMSASGGRGVARGRSDQGERSSAKREQIIQAAISTLVEVGFSRASTRAIAATGGFNQALIHYHFGSLNALWLAALDHTSKLRMERYQAASADAGSIEELVEVAVSIYKEDLESGHMTVVSELVAGSLSEPELGPAIVERMEPWIAFVEGIIHKVLAGTPFEMLIPKREAASALVAFYLGVNMLSRLESDHARIDSWFETARRLTPTLSPMLEAMRTV